MWASLRLSFTAAMNACSAIAPRSAQSAAIVAAILIGDRAGLSVDVQRRLRTAGTYHVIAISGGARTRNFDYLRMAGSLGAAEIIRKPFEAEELLSRLDRLRAASLVGTAS